MPFRTSLPILASLICVTAVPGNLWAQFAGEFANGTRFKDAQLVNWPQGKDPPRLKEALSGNKGRDLGALFDAKNPVSWLFNERAEPPNAAPRPGVELFGGDRLPGQILGYRYGTELAVDRQPAHLLVKIDPDAVQSPRAMVRVRTAAVRKVVWQPRRGDRYLPSTLFLLDDRQIHFRAVRWTHEAVTLLLNEGGTRTVGFGEIAELHLPRRDPWQVFQETLTVLSPDCTARLMRLETSRSLVLTGTMERSQVSATTHLLQPAWCLEPVGFLHPQLRWWRFFWPHEVPLSIIEPLRAEQRSPLDAARSWQADQNVKHQPLRSGRKLYGGGFGMQSDCELEFELPPMVQAFRTMVGMDELAGRNGCGRGSIYLNSRAEKPLWQSKILVGASEVMATERLPLQGPAHGQKSLILVAEAPIDKPADADPLNIRSFVDWLEPVVVLDLAQLRSEVQKRILETIPAWQGWTVSATKGSFRISPRWDVHELPATRIIPDVVHQGGPFLLSREVEVGTNQNYLSLALAQEPGRPSGWVEVRVDGRPVGEFTVPQWHQDPDRRWITPAGFLVPLMKYRGKTVKLEVEYHPVGETGTVEWRGLELVRSKDLADWIPVEVIEARATAPETTIVREPDHTMFARLRDPSKVPLTDTYTITAETPATEISSIRLELLADARLPRNGPGRSWDGYVLLSEFKVTAAPRNKPDQAEPVALTAAGTDYFENHPPSAAVDGNPESGWLPVPFGQTHVIVFTPTQPIAHPSGTRLVFTIEQNLAIYKTQGTRSPGRFRLQVTSAPRPVPVARPSIVLEVPGRKTLFEDEFDFINQLRDGQGVATLETKDKYSGTACIKATGSRQQRTFLGDIRIRREPGRGEFRYLQFAWKKAGGQAISIQLAHDQWFGPSKPHAFRYHAGPGKPWGADSLEVSPTLPKDWVLVTRDLFADFGEFTLTGLSLDTIDGSHALYDHIRLARSLKDLDNE